MPEPLTLRLTIDVPADHGHATDAVAAIAGEPFPLDRIAEAFSTSDWQPLREAEQALNDFLLDGLGVDVEIEFDPGPELRRLVDGHSR